MKDNNIRQAESAVTKAIRALPPERDNSFSQPCICVVQEFPVRPFYDQIDGD